MNIFIFGANGQIGRHLVDKLTEKEGYTVKVGLRKEEQFPYFEDKNVTPVLIDLEDTTDNLARALKGTDTVVFTAGSGGKTGPDKTLLIDLDGAVKTMEAAEAVGVNQYVLVSAFGAGDRSTWSEEIKPYYVAKYYADQALIHSRLNYTIVRPGMLTNDEGQGTASVNNSDDLSIPRKDVAAVLAEVIGKKNTYKKEFNLLPGNVKIEELVQEI